MPFEDVRRRFVLGLWNMHNLYLPLAYAASIYDNSQRDWILIAEGEPGSDLRVVDQERWLRIEEMTSWK